MAASCYKTAMLLNVESVLSRAVPALVLAALCAPLPASEIGAKMAANLSDVEEKIVGLAEAIPDDKYSWSPEGARKTSEVFMHLASANHFFAGRLGGPKPPEDMGEWEKTVTSKADVIAKVKSSFAVIKSALEGADMDKATKLFGGKEGTLSDFALIAVGHGHEPLGQLIAYARSNDIAPPWSR